jgi:transposase
MSPNTERALRKVLHDHELLEGPADDLPSAEMLRDLMAVARPSSGSAQSESSVEEWTATIKRLFDEGARPKAIFDWLKSNEPEFRGSLSAVKRYVARLRRERGVQESEVVIRTETPPGLVAQVDFGDVGQLMCPTTNRLRRAYVFVMVLGYSRHMFARIVFDQCARTWLALHAAAFAFFNGVVATVVPDNLKSAVIRAAFDVRTEAELNLSYRDLARHYGFSIDPTPPYNPEKKGKVESAVKYIKGNFIATLGDRDDIDRVNAQLQQWVLKVAGERHHGTTHEPPMARFERVEQAALRPCPDKPWTHVDWRRVIVRRDSYVCVDGAAYSVPWRLIGREVMVRLIEASLEIYWDDARVATHERATKGMTATIESHLPASRRDYRHRDPAYWRERAAAIAPEVASYIDEVFASDSVQSQVTKVAAMIQLFESVGVERSRATCRRASYYANFSHAGVKKILQDGLDRQPLPLAIINSTSNLIAPKFARSLAQVLESTEVGTHAPN